MSSASTNGWGQKLSYNFILNRAYTQRNIFEIMEIKPKADCFYHLPIDLEQQTDTVRLLFQINLKMVSTI